MEFPIALRQGVEETVLKEQAADEVRRVQADGVAVLVVIGEAVVYIAQPDSVVEHRLLRVDDFKLVDYDVVCHRWWWWWWGWWWWRTSQRHNVNWAANVLVSRKQLRAVPLDV